MGGRFIAAALGGAALVGTIGLMPAPAQAQELGASSIHAGSVEVPVNKSQVITADRAISRAMIGNDEIADIFPISDKSVYVLGKKVGTTSLTLYDRSNQVMAVLDIAVGPDVTALREQFEALIPGEPIEARISNDSIVLSGLVSDATVADRAVRLAQTYAGDKVVNLLSVGSSQQVMLEVRFAEVSRNVGKELGVSGFFNSNGGNFSGAIGNGAGIRYDATNPQGINKLDPISGSFGIFRRFFSNLAGLSVDAAVNTLENRGLLKTLANPTLVSLSGERASFLAGGEFPIPVVQNGGGGGNGVGGQSITVEFKPFGVSLGFTPTVLADKTINLLVEPEVSSLDPNASITLNGIRIPGLQTRRASTVLEMRDGESFAIAGLISQDFQTTVNQIPILGSLPIIGSLFRSSSFKKGETELLIIVTPRLVQPIKPSQVVLPTDRIRDPNQADVLLNGTAYRPVGNETGQLPSQKGAVRFDPAHPETGYTAPSGQAAPATTQPAPAKAEDGYEY